jgi:hypothetical protein
MEDVGFDRTGMAWNGGCRFLSWLEWLGMEEVGFDLTGMAWNEEVGFGLTGMACKKENQFCPDRKAKNGGGQFWPDLNDLDWQMSVLSDWFPQHLVRVG